MHATYLILYGRKQEKWKETAKSGGYSIKYYKGLGTSTTVEAKEYFKDMKKVTYVWDEQSDESMKRNFRWFIFKNLGDDFSRNSCW